MQTANKETGCGRLFRIIYTTITTCMCFSINIEPVNETIRANVGHLEISDPLGISERIGALPAVAGSDKVPD